MEDSSTVGVKLALWLAEVRQFLAAHLELSSVICRFESYHTQPFISVQIFPIKSRPAKNFKVFHTFHRRPPLNGCIFNTTLQAGSRKGEEIQRQSSCLFIGISIWSPLMQLSQWLTWTDCKMKEFMADLIQNAYNYSWLAAASLQPLNLTNQMKLHFDRMLQAVKCALEMHGWKDDATPLTNTSCLLSKHLVQHFSRRANCHVACLHGIKQADQAAVAPSQSFCGEIARRQLVREYRDVVRKVKVCVRLTRRVSEETFCSSYLVCTGKMGSKMRYEHQGESIEELNMVSIGWKRSKERSHWLRQAYLN